MKTVYTALIVCIFYAVQAAAKSQKPHFNSWYPDNSDYLEGLLRNQCAKQQEFYLTHTGEPGNDSGAIRPLIDCLLNEAGELITANFAAAGVLLGLLPSVLSLAGTGKYSVAIAAIRIAANCSYLTRHSGNQAIVFKTAVLALLLSAGSVSVAPMRTYE
jgi:VIT1/CCC1 family predicted Fe2+/Mn2+ transporter